MKKLIAHILSVVLVLSLLHSIPIAAADESGKVITGTVLAGDDDIDLDGIVIEIYSSVLTYSDKDTSVYDNYFQESVSCAADGSFSFKAPSERFVTFIDLTSLPERTGVNTFSLSWVNGNTTEQFVVSKIAKIEIPDYAYRNYSPYLYDAKGNIIQAKYTLTGQIYQMPDLNSDNFYDFDFITSSVTVSANGVTQVFTYEDFLENYDEFNRLEFLYYLDMINRHELMSGYADLIMSGKGTESMTSVSDQMYRYIYYKDIYGRELSPEVLRIRQKVKAVVDEELTRYFKGLPLPVDPIVLEIKRVGVMETLKQVVFGAFERSDTFKSAEPDMEPTVVIVSSDDGCLELRYIISQTNADVGETITAEVALTNLTDKDYTFTFGGGKTQSKKPPVYYGFSTWEDYEKLAYPQLSDDITIAPYETLFNSIEFVPEADGEYIFFAEMPYTIGGENMHLGTDPTIITVGDPFADLL
jgi:hypothetical protein